LVYELGIYLILAKHEKTASNRLAKQVGINGKLPSLPLPGDICAQQTRCHRDFWRRRLSSRARESLSSRARPFLSHAPTAASSRAFSFQGRAPIPMVR
jgi:hypothetical protein